MNWILCLILLFAMLSGCASSYTLSEEGLNYRESLTAADALRAIKQNIQKSGEQAGLCGAHTNKQFYRATLIKFFGPYIEFEGFYSVIIDKGSKLSSHHFTTTTFEIRRGYFIIDVQELDSITVYKTTKFDCLDPLLAENIVEIDVKGGVNVAEMRPTAVMINVSTKNLDHFLAALTFFSPDAKLIKGKMSRRR
jgi:hypothetical protein